MFKGYNNTFNICEEEMQFGNYVLEVGPLPAEVQQGCSLACSCKCHNLDNLRKGGIDVIYKA